MYACSYWCMLLSSLHLEYPVYMNLHICCLSEEDHLEKLPMLDRLNMLIMALNKDTSRIGGVGSKSIVAHFW